jgi:phosphoribosylformylglycinamidine synthase
MRAAVMVLPGSNRDTDTKYVLHDLLKIKTDLLWYKETDLSPYDLIVIPGGFAYGDYLRAGAIARFAPAVHALGEYVAQKRGLVLGICNGFQVLTESGLLPGALARNEQKKFVCKRVTLRIENSETPFTQFFKAGETVELPIAHAEGRYVDTPDAIERLQHNQQILLTYVGENPNGSVKAIAGITNEARTVFGLMPHPEHNCETLLGSGAGLKFFQSLLHSREAVHG